MNAQELGKPAMNAVDVLRWYMNGDASRIEAEQALDRLARLAESAEIVVQPKGTAPAPDHMHFVAESDMDDLRERLSAVLGEEPPK